MPTPWQTLLLVWFLGWPFAILTAALLARRHRHPVLFVALPVVLSVLGLAVAFATCRRRDTWWPEGVTPPGKTRHR